MHSNWRHWLRTPSRARTGALAMLAAQACASCHAAQYQAWAASQHAHSMQPMRRDTVLAPFAGETLRHGSVTSRFTREGERWWVQTDGADGKLQRFEVLHTFGVYPLQQYLVALEGRRLQALATAWDSRPRSQG